MKMVACLAVWMACAVALSQEAKSSDGVWNLRQEKVAVEVKKDYPEMNHPDSELARLVAYLARASSHQNNADHEALLTDNAPRYFADMAARLLGMAVIRNRVTVERSVAERRKSSPVAGALETIGDAEISIPSNGYFLTVWDYPLMRNGKVGPERTDEPNGVEGPRFRFWARSDYLGDEVAWNVFLSMTEAGQNAVPAVTSKEYLAFVDRCLDRFREDVPGAKVHMVYLALTDDSEILANVVKALRPVFESAKSKSLTELRDRPIEGKALAFPKDSFGVFFHAAQASPESQRIGEEMARRLGQKYVKVVGGGERFAFGKKGAFYGKPWDELLKDRYLGIEPWTMELAFVFESQPPARQ